MKTAVIGIGSNSVRMLLAEVDGSIGRRMARDREATRLFAGLGADGRLDPGAMEKTADAVVRMARSARRQGAEEVLAFATSATRDAANGEEFTALLHREAAVELCICSGEEEAALSFLGATGGGRCGVIDIGGGSTELIVGDGAAIERAVSCQVGAVRLFRCLSINGPEDLEPVVTAAREVFKETADGFVSGLPERWYGTGGTFTALGALERGVHWTDRTDLHGTRITRDAALAQARRLSAMSVAERLRLDSLQPGRADIVVHGICILLACMDFLSLHEITVSEYGNLDGYLKRTYSLTTLLSH